MHALLELYIHTSFIIHAVSTSFIIHAVSFDAELCDRNIFFFQ